MRIAAVPGVYRHPGKLEEISRIALLRAGRPGDAVVALPAIASLRQTYPGATITWLGRRRQTGFLEGRQGGVDEVWEIPAVYGVGSDHTASLATLKTFFEKARRARFDLALQMHGGGRYSNPFLLQLKARHTVGAAAPDAPSLDRTLPYNPAQHEILRCLDLARLAGAEAASCRVALTPTRAEQDELERNLDPNQRAAPLVVLNPGASDPRRRWPADRFAEVGEVLAARGATLVVNGSGEEGALTKAVQSALFARALDFGGRLSLGGLLALLDAADLLVTNDTACLHMAMAVGTPTVSVQWFYSALTYGPLSRLQDRVHVSYRIQCPECDAPAFSACNHQTSWLEDIETADVIRSCLHLIDRPLSGREGRAA